MLERAGLTVYPFRYFRDPLFLGCSFLYSINRFFIKPHMPRDELFFRGHLNDLLLIPCLLPPILFVHRRLLLRRTDDPPSVREILIHLLIWSLLFEYIGPLFYPKAISDPWDVVSYVVGGLFAWINWNHISPLAKIN